MSASRPISRPPPAWAGVGRAFAAALALFAVVLAWSWLRTRDYTALERLPAEERRQVYLRTMANLTGVCARPDARRFEAFCREQAEVALFLPECDASCGRVARAHLVYPTR